MGVDRLKIPDVYLCELCEPRYVDKHHAIRCQAKKREVLSMKSAQSDNFIIILSRYSLKSNCGHI